MIAIRYDISSRRGGKTARAVEWLKRKKAEGVSAAIVVQTAAEKEILEDVFGLDPDDVVTRRCRQRLLGRRQLPEVWLDNVELMLQDEWFPYRIAGLSMTWEDSAYWTRVVSPEIPYDSNYIDALMYLREEEISDWVASLETNPSFEMKYLGKWE